MQNWYFPYGKDIEPESVNNARIETFRDNIVESLAREICQNSLDAALYDDKPVKVVFEEREIDTNKIPDIESFKDEIIPLSRETWKKDRNAQEFLNTYEEILNGDKIKVLKISDFNTIGLEKENWESLIEKAGTSVKNDIGSAGSFGIGKAAPFASSDLRMVFYSTKLKDGIEKSIGVTKFISYDRTDDMTTQGVGYLGEQGKIPMNNQKSFGFDKRLECGTDIYIIGFNQKEDWSKEIISSLLESFMVSIYEEKLIIRVKDIEINKVTMGSLIMKLKDGNVDELKNYYSVLIDENSLKISLDERFKRYGFNDDDGYLLISKGEEANRSVLMTRKAGMKIYDRKNISGSIQFNGIFQATGNDFNAMLKAMENPNHNDWIADRYRDTKEAKKLLQDIYRFCKENVMEYYQEKVENQIDAFGISEFLPNRLNKEETDSKEDEGLEEEIREVVLKPREAKKSGNKAINNKEFEDKLVRDGIIDGDEYGKGTPKDSDTKIKGGKNYGGVGNPDGKNKLDEEGTRNTLRKNRKFEETSKYKATIIEEDYRNGKYRLMLRGKSNTEKVKVELNLVGENGSGYKESIISAKIKEENLVVFNNYLIIESPSDDLNIIELKLPFKNRVKTEVSIYEYR